MVFQSIASRTTYHKMPLLFLANVSPAVRERRATEASVVAPSHSLAPDTHRQTYAHRDTQRNTQASRTKREEVKHRERQKSTG